MPCLSPHIAQLALQSTWHVLHLAELAELAKLAKQACLLAWMAAHDSLRPDVCGHWSMAGQWLTDMRTMVGSMRSAPARDVLKTPVWALFQV